MVLSFDMEKVVVGFLQGNFFVWWLTGGTQDGKINNSLKELFGQVFG